MNGLQAVTDFNSDGYIDITPTTMDDGVNAWKFDAEAGQGKVYISTALLRGKTTFSFSAYVPAESTTELHLPTSPLFAIRVKPNDSEPALDGSQNGHIEFSTGADIEACKLTYGQWKTYTIDITGTSDVCTEFAFILAADNVLYVKDMIVE